MGDSSQVDENVMRSQMPMVSNVSKIMNRKEDLTQLEGNLIL